MKKNSTSATVGFFRAIGAKNIRSHTQMPDALRARLPESEVVDVADHLNKEEYWGNLSKEELEAMESFRNASYERSLAISLVRYYSRMRDMFSFYEERRRFLGDRILEVGCRNGLLSCFLGYLCRESRVVGIDSLPFGLPHGRRTAEELQITNVEFLQADLDEYPTEAMFDTIVLTSQMARRGFMQQSYANYMSLMSAAIENAQVYASFAKAVSDRLKVGGFLFFSDTCAYDSTFLGMLIAFANVGIVWRNHDSNRGGVQAIEDRPVSQVNEYDLLFEKKSDGPEEMDGIVSDFLNDAFRRPGTYVKERADAVMHLHAGEVIAGFTATFEFEDGGAEGVAAVGWKDRSEDVVWLEIQSSGFSTVFRFPAEKSDWVAGAVWLNAHLVAKENPDVFERLMGAYNDLEVESITDVAVLPEGNPNEVDSEEDDADDGGVDEETTALPISAMSFSGSPFPASAFPTAKDFKPQLSPLDVSFLGKEKNRPVEAKTSEVFFSMMKASRREVVPKTDGTGFCDNKRFRIIHPPQMNERPRKKKPMESASVLASAEPQETKLAGPRTACSSVVVSDKRTLRLTFISKSGRLNVENMETGSQWRADSSGVRIEDESVGHVASRKIEDSDFTMTTSAGQIVLRDDACGYEFTIRALGNNAKSGLMSDD